MSFFSAIMGGPKKEPEEDRMRRVAQSSSAVGNMFGTTPYSREWGRRKKEILEKHKKNEKDLKEVWRKEDKEIARALTKKQGEYGRKMKPEHAEKYFDQYEQKKRREVQRERDRDFRSMEMEKNTEVRRIARDIRQWK